MCFWVWALFIAARERFRTVFLSSFWLTGETNFRWGSILSPELFFPCLQPPPFLRVGATGKSRSKQILQTQIRSTTIFCSKVEKSASKSFPTHKLIDHRASPTYNKIPWSHFLRLGRTKEKKSPKNGNCFPIFYYRPSTIPQLKTKRICKKMAVEWKQRQVSTGLWAPSGWTVNYSSQQLSSPAKSRLKSFWEIPWNCQCLCYNDILPKSQYNAITIKIMSPSSLPLVRWGKLHKSKIVGKERVKNVENSMIIENKISVCNRKVSHQSLKSTW